MSKKIDKKPEEVVPKRATLSVDFGDMLADLREMSDEQGYNAVGELIRSLVRPAVLHYRKQKEKAA